MRTHHCVQFILIIIYVPIYCEIGLFCQFDKINSLFDKSIILIISTKHR